MRKTASVLVYILLSISVGAAEINFSGETLFSFAASGQNTGSITDVSLKQSLDLDVYGNDASLYLNGGVRYDALENSLNLFLSEAYAGYHAGSCAFRLGKQKATWGNAELLSAVDVITPSDLSNPVSMEKKAINALKASYDAFPYAADFYWIPVFTPSVSLPAFEPEPSLENSEYALKASAYTSAGDFALYGYYGWEDIPSFHGSGAGYDRLVMAGASAAVPAGDVTFKAEAGWYPKRDSVISVMTGLEWIHNDLTIVAELYGEWNSKTEKLSGRAGTGVSYNLLDGDLELSVAGLLELRELDGAVVAQAQYAFTDEFKASVSAVYIFEGPDGPGTYGVFKDLNSVRFSATYSF